MIECSHENIYYIKKRKNRKRLNMRFFCLLLLIALVLIYYFYVVLPFITNVLSEKAYNVNVRCINDAVISSLEGVKYEDLVVVEKNSEGEIVLITSNVNKVNLIAREVIKNSENNIATNLKDGIELPLLSFLGLNIVSGYGSNISIKSISISNINCDFISEFKGAGINQTIHSVYLIINSNLSINFPFSRQEKQFSTKVLVCESVLVGKVPEIYLSDKLFNR